MTAPQQVPLNDLARAYCAQADLVEDAVSRVLRSGWYVMGHEHDAFEAEFAMYCGRAHCVGVANGTDALEIALRATGCRPGSRVAMVANAGMYAASACVAIGAVPVFVDVDEKSLLMTERSFGEALDRDCWGIVATHLYGTLVDVDAIRSRLGSEIKIIEDCAQAHGARRGSDVAGSLGDAAAFSFYPTKNMGALGDGGAIVTDDAEIARRARQLRQYGWRERYVSELAGGRNSRLDEIQAAVLRVRLRYLDAANERRRSIVQRYRARAPRLDFVLPQNDETAAHLCVVRHRERERFRKGLAAKGIATAVHYPLLDTEQAALRDATWHARPLPTSQRAAAEIVTLPCFPEMTDAEVAYVADAIADFQ
jgi:dTDP-4-amino-4,6-dideoxygalactose transaminase